MKAQYITATEVAEIMGISRSKSYFKQKFYGFQIPGGERDVG